MRNSPICSIKKNTDFKKVYGFARYEANKYFVVYAMPNSLGYMRLGISIKKKVGGSVLRNRLRRLIKENFRIHQNKSLAVDVVVVARNGAGEIAAGNGFWLTTKFLSLPRVSIR